MSNAAVTKLIKGESYWGKLYIDSFNKRVRIDEFRGSVREIVNATEKIAKEISAGEIIVKARYEDFSDLLVCGFNCEAKLDRYFLGSDAYFFAKYLFNSRRETEHWITEDRIIKNVYHLEKQLNEKLIPEHVVLRKAEKNDASGLAELYKKVFPIYPTPLHDSNYIVNTIEKGDTIYYIFENNGECISAASAEVNLLYRNAELTDCATLEFYRKHGLVKKLLKKLEEELRKSSVFCVYSLARAQSFGMNAALFQLGYQYQGRLLNNCFIYEKLENMNLWVKDLSV